MVAILFFKNVSTVQSKILLEVHKIMFILIGLLQSVQNFWEVYKSIFILIDLLRSLLTVTFCKLAIPKRLTVDRYLILTCIGRCFTSVNSFNPYNNPVKQIFLLILQEKKIVS